MLYYLTEIFLNDMFWWKCFDGGENVEFILWLLFWNCSRTSRLIWSILLVLLASLHQTFLRHREFSSLLRVKCQCMRLCFQIYQQSFHRNFSRITYHSMGFHMKHFDSHTICLNSWMIFVFNKVYINSVKREIYPFTNKVWNKFLFGPVDPKIQHERHSQYLAEKNSWLNEFFNVKILALAFPALISFAHTKLTPFYHFGIYLRRFLVTPRQSRLE